MKAKLLLILLVVGCATISFAQVQEKEQTNPYKNDIGFNTTFIFQGIFNSNPAPFTFMIKHYKGDHKAIRYGMNVSIYDNQNQRNLSSYYQNYSYANIALTIGKEFQQNINTKWVWYHGGDLAPYYSSQTSSSFENGLELNYLNSWGAGLGFRPFIGIRYNINSRLYVSAEASIQLQYGYNKLLIKNYNPQETTIRNTQGRSASLSTSPASGLFIFYRF